MIFVVVVVIWLVFQMIHFTWYSCHWVVWVGGCCDLWSQLTRISRCELANPASWTVVYMSSASLEVLRELPSLSARLQRGQEDRMPGSLPTGPQQSVAQPAQLMPPIDLRPLLANEEPPAEGLAHFGLRAGSSIVVLARVGDFTSCFDLPAWPSTPLSSSPGSPCCLVEHLLIMSISYPM